MKIWGAPRSWNYSEDTSFRKLSNRIPQYTDSRRSHSVVETIFQRQTSELLPSLSVSGDPVTNFEGRGIILLPLSGSHEGRLLITTSGESPGVTTPKISYVYIFFKPENTIHGSMNTQSITVQ